MCSQETQYSSVARSWVARTGSSGFAEYALKRVGCVAREITEECPDTFVFAIVCSKVHSSEWGSFDCCTLLVKEMALVVRFSISWRSEFAVPTYKNSVSKTAGLMPLLHLHGRVSSVLILGGSSKFLLKFWARWCVEADCGVPAFEGPIIFCGEAFRACLRTADEVRVSKLRGSWTFSGERFWARWNVINGDIWASKYADFWIFLVGEMLRDRLRDKGDAASEVVCSWTFLGEIFWTRWRFGVVFEASTACFLLSAPGFSSMFVPLSIWFSGPLLKEIDKILFDVFE